MSSCVAGIFISHHSAAAARHTLAFHHVVLLCFWLLDAFRFKSGLFSGDCQKAFWEELAYGGKRLNVLKDGCCNTEHELDLHT